MARVRPVRTPAEASGGRSELAREPAPAQAHTSANRERARSYRSVPALPSQEVAIAANALLQVRIAADVKEEAAAVLTPMGLTVSDAIRLLLTRIAREHALPFDPFVPNEETVAAMQDARRGKLVAFESIDESVAELKADE